MSPIKRRYVYLHKRYLVLFNKFKKDDATQVCFLWLKGSTYEGCWIHLASKAHIQVVFPFRKAFVEDILFGFIKKNHDYVYVAYIG
jgi:hypothetical protein